ncbi:hypothetical protein B0H63DRAFT_448781 [Podospora didyma]|uniref:Ubiquitin-like protease family profile domain-containing protein n=1 Tax=Podospora didyma TaxID=330526 RepID=A0AAE0U228_9PEZI|nr:hypothetical protein B0H63DRAFT_448781 [Podospora didyma]
MASRVIEIPDDDTPGNNSSAIRGPGFMPSITHMSPTGLQSLEGHNWLNDEIINGILEMLVSLRPEFHTIKSNLLSPTANYASDPVSSDENIRKHIPFQSPNDVAVLIVNLQGTHWACIVIDAGNREFQIYDSLPNSPQMDDLAHVARKIVRAKFAKAVQGLEAGHGWTVHFMNSLMQRNGNDCGIHALVSAMCVVLRRGVKPDLPDKINCKMWRWLFRALATPDRATHHDRHDGTLLASIPPEFKQFDPRHMKTRDILADARQAQTFINELISHADRNVWVCDDALLNCDLWLQESSLFRPNRRADIDIAKRAQRYLRLRMVTAKFTRTRLGRLAMDDAVRALERVAMVEGVYYDRMSRLEDVFLDCPFQGAAWKGQPRNR